MTNNVAYKTGEALQVLSFEVGTQTYCVPVNSVREIRGVTPPTQLPDAPPYVRGVINLRGQVMPVIDLSARLGKGVAEDGPRQVIIVIESGTTTSPACWSTRSATASSSTPTRSIRPRRWAKRTRRWSRP
jgi:purine-binding chemotaxis protein CheW